MINGASHLVQVAACGGTPAQVPFPGVPLENGTYAAATRDDYLDANTADPELRKGLAGLNVIREISILAIPDEVMR